MSENKIKDVNGSKVTKSQAKEIINDIIQMSQGEEFKGAGKQGDVDVATFSMPESIDAAQAKERELRESGNARAAGQFAQGFLGTIAQKLIYQTILTGSMGDDLSFIEKFRGENIDYGVGKEWVATQMSGYQEFDMEAFVPSATTKATAITQVANFLNQQGQLNTSSNAFMKQFCITITNYNTKEYFLSDVKLQQFIQTIRDAAVNGAKLYLYNLVMTMIANGITNAKTTPNGTDLKLINGTATNMFDACIEVCNHIRRMVKLGNKYQLIGSTNASENFVRASSFDNLTWIWSIDNDEKANRGIKSQLYHYRLWDPTNSISESNVYTPGTKITLPDLTTNKANNYPTDTGQMWIDNNTVVVLENGAIEYNIVWEKAETQYYTNNMALQITYNLAGMINFVKTMRGFVYKNNNLSTEPTN